jgi:enoyl-CoA hydratase
MTEYQQILYEKQGAIARVILNRPRYRNAQSHLLLDEMDDAFQNAADDDTIRVIILSGAGDHFSSGHDLGTPEEEADVLERAYEDGIRGTYARFAKTFLEYGLRWRAIPKPTIAMIQGYCIYGGWQIASSMDLIVASEDTQLLPGFIEYFSVPWDIGVRKTKELLFENRFMDAEEAQRCGFVNRVFPKDRLESETLALAERIAETDPFRTRMVKLSANQAQDAMGFHIAVQAALSNYLVGMDVDRDKSERRLPTVDLALRNQARRTEG